MSQPPVLVDAKYDNIFKSIVSSEWCVRSDGHVESSVGYFSITEIPSHAGELEQMMEAVDNASVVGDEWPESGWYITVENNQGLIFVYKQLNEQAAWHQYHNLEKDFADYELASDEEE